MTKRVETRFICYECATRLTKTKYPRTDQEAPFDCMLCGQNKAQYGVEMTSEDGYVPKTIEEAEEMGKKLDWADRVVIDPNELAKRILVAEGEIKAVEDDEICPDCGKPASEHPSQDEDQLPDPDNPLRLWINGHEVPLGTGVRIPVREDEVPEIIRRKAKERGIQLQPAPQPRPQPAGNSDGCPECEQACQLKPHSYFCLECERPVKLKHSQPFKCSTCGKRRQRIFAVCPVRLNFIRRLFAGRKLYRHALYYIGDKIVGK